MSSHSQARTRIVVVEGDEVLFPSDIANMKLPFNRGWESWAVVQGNHVVLLTSKYILAYKTCQALNNMDLVL